MFRDLTVPIVLGGLMIPIVLGDLRVPIVLGVFGLQNVKKRRKK